MAPVTVDVAVEDILAALWETSKQSEMVLDIDTLRVLILHGIQDADIPSEVRP
ncbi:MAG TPA: hypothetical protein VNZ58_15145 [Thermomicrobiales bacterium]|nr:hypothetical protein [Thermomicrobiales bacterium]